MVPKINPAGLDVDEVADMNTSATDLDAYDIIIDNDDDHDDVDGDIMRATVRKRAS